MVEHHLLASDLLRNLQLSLDQHVKPIREVRLREKELAGRQAHVANLPCDSCELLARQLREDLDRAQVI